MSKGGVKFEAKSTAALLRIHGLEANGRVQAFIDGEVMRRMEPYMPFLSGNMVGSMFAGTRAGSGEIVVNTPYAGKRLYSARKNGLRGPNYFERMKADHRASILAGAAKIAKGSN